MTEAQWRECADPERMLAFRFALESGRKFRLFACACCRALWPLFPGEFRDRGIVLTSEAAADGRVGPAELAHAGRRMLVNSAPEHSTARASAFEAALYAARLARAAAGRRADDRSIGAIFQERAALEQARLARDVFGNPFRAAPFDPSWLTDTVVQLARGAYDEYAFDRMPILADALQDAGCDSDDILDHCRGPGPHARGCWVVDLLLGKG